MEATTLRVRALVDWLNLLRDLDFDGVRNLLTALQDLKAAVTPAEKVEAALRVLRVTAQLTPMTGDDTLVAWLDKLMTPEMIAVIAKLLGLFNTVTPVEATATATCEGGCGCTTEDSVAVLTAADAELQAKAIPWALLLQLLPVILELIEKFRNRT